MELLVASTNPGKIREFADLLADLPVRISGLRDHGPLPMIEETGITFRTNACLKAAGYALATKMWTLADDSGLAVDALAGKPGVYSARWAEMHQSGQGDAANNALLLEQLQSTPDERRTARFVCVLALANPWGQIVLTAMDHVEGRILHSARGENGFGYDPLFLIDALGKTTAELPPAQKHSISHRGKALRRMHEILMRVKLLG